MLTQKEPYLRRPYQPPKESQIIATEKFSHTCNLRSIPLRSASCRADPAEKQNSLGTDLEAVRYTRQLLMAPHRTQSLIHSTNTSQAASSQINAGDLRMKKTSIPAPEREKVPEIGDCMLK